MTIIIDGADRREADYADLDLMTLASAANQGDGQAAAELHRRAQVSTKAFDPAERRDGHGRWSRSGGGVTHALGSAGKAMDGIKVEGRPEGAGTVEDPILVHDDLDRAARLLSEGKHIRLDDKRQVSTLLNKLAATVKDAEKRRSKAPVYDLCHVSVPGTNLFCQQSRGVPRAKMPQLKGFPKEGSPAALRNGGRTDQKVSVEEDFRNALVAMGIPTHVTRVPASELRASQSELSGVGVVSMVQGIRDGKVPDRPIFITRDGYVIDGHHRWAANVAIDTEDGHLGDITMAVEIINMDIGAALDFATAFTHAMGIEPKAHGEARTEAKADVSLLPYYERLGELIGVASPELELKLATGTSRDCACCNGTGEHKDGHECYACDASGQEVDREGTCVDYKAFDPGEARDARGQWTTTAGSFIDSMRRHLASGVSEYGWDLNDESDRALARGHVREKLANTRVDWVGQVATAMGHPPKDRTRSQVTRSMADALIAEHQGESKDFDPNERRDDHGRWARGGGGLAHALSKIPLAPRQSQSREGLKDPVKANASLLSDPTDPANLPPEVVAQMTAHVEKTFGVTPEKMRANLREVFARADAETRATGAGWYSTANSESSVIAKRDGFALPLVVGAVAATSPQTEWGANIQIVDYLSKAKAADWAMTPDALKALSTSKTKGATKADKVTMSLLEWAKLEAGKKGSTIPDLNGQHLSEIGDPVAVAALVKALGQAGYQTSDGKPLAYTDDVTGNRSQVAFSSGIDGLAKAWRILDGEPTGNVINGHKVRSFYNNILLNESNPFGDVTIDTHAVSAAAGTKISAGDPRIAKGFNTPTVAPIGLKGPYPIFAAAYRDVAAENGLKPHQAQAIIWLQWRKEHP